MTGRRKKQRVKGNNTALRPLLSVCLIAKDEEANIARCLRSVKGVADEMIVVDTGSTDHTVEIARRCGARVGFFQWCDDFAAARNAALELAKGQWVLQMDADEELAAEAKSKVRSLVSNARPEVWAFFIPSVSLIEREGYETQTITYRLLLFRNHPHLRYRGRIHEGIRFIGSGSKPRYEFSSEIVIRHYGYLPGAMEAKNKLERNLRLLAMALEEEPDNPFCNFSIGKQYCIMGRFELATAYLRKAVDLCTNPTTSYLPDAYTSLVTALWRGGRFTELRSTIEEAEGRVRELPADFYHNAGMALVSAGEPDKALAYFQRAIGTGAILTASETDPAAHTWLPRYGIGRIYEARGQLQDAWLSYSEALRYVPGHPGLNARAAVVASKLGNNEEALGLLGKATHYRNLSDQLRLELLGVCERLADDEKVNTEHQNQIVALAGQLIEAVPLTLENGARLAGLCFRFGKFERGVAAASHVLENGEDLLARINRGLCHFSLGNYAEAADDFSKAVQMAPNDTTAASLAKDLAASLARAKNANPIVQLDGSDSTCDDQQRSADRTCRKCLVSIIVPVRNECNLLEQCVQAIIEGIPDDLYEIIVVDNGSTDGTHDFLSRLSGDFIAIRSQVNLRFARACNEGVKQANGKYLLILHPNVRLRADWLHCWLSILENQPAVGAVCATSLVSDVALQAVQPSVHNVMSGSTQNVPVPGDRAHEGRATDPDFYLGRMAEAALLVSAGLWRELGGLDEDYGLSEYAIADLILRMRRSGRQVAWREAELVRFAPRDKLAICLPEPA